MSRPFFLHASLIDLTIFSGCHAAFFVFRLSLRYEYDLVLVDVKNDENEERKNLRLRLLLQTSSIATNEVLAIHQMCTFCDLMPKEEGNDSTINHQVFGFFSPAAIEEAVQKHNATQKKQEIHDEDDKRRPSSKNGSDSHKDAKAK